MLVSRQWCVDEFYDVVVACGPLDCSVYLAEGSAAGWWCGWVVVESGGGVVGWWSGWVVEDGWRCGCVFFN